MSDLMYIRKILRNKRYKNKKTIQFGWFVDPQGFEPRLTVPKTGVLPLHYRSVFILVMQIYRFFHYMQELFTIFFTFTLLFIHGNYADRLQ